MNRDSVRTLQESEDGMISIAAVIGVLFFLILFALLSNVVFTINHRVEVQNGADSAAYSAALWKARGMNAVTGVNHVLGELTAIVALHEAIGGPQLGTAQDTNEIDKADSLIGLDDSILKAVVVAWPGYTTTYVRSIDQNLVPKAAKDISGDINGAATLYDSQLTLKTWLDRAFKLKVIANLVVLISKFPYLSWLEPIGTGMHVMGSAVTAKAWQEWIWLDGIQQIAEMTSRARTGLEQGVIPTIAAYGMVVAEGLPLAAIRQSIDQLEVKNRIEQLAVGSPPRDVQSLHKIMPLIPSEPPKSGNVKLPTGFDPKETPVYAPFAGEFAAAQDEWKDELDEWLDGFPDGVRDIYEGIFDFAASSAKSLLSSFIPQINWLEFGLDWPEPHTDEYWPENETAESYDQIDCDWNDEKYTQWVRATYPQVDVLRFPARKAMRQFLGMPLSNAAGWYVHWSNKATLVISHSMRAKKNLKMYIMEGSSPGLKGHESWTVKSAGNQQNQMFAMSGYAEDPIGWQTSPVFFGKAPNERHKAYAQALFYNANEFSPPSKGTYGTVQPNVGWDTLNWESPVEAPEYGNVAQLNDRSFFGLPDLEGFLRNPAAGSPADLLDFTKTPANVARRSAIKLNWQAKLVPVTRKAISIEAITIPPSNVRVDHEQFHTH